MGRARGIKDVGGEAGATVVARGVGFIPSHCCESVGTPAGIDPIATGADTATLTGTNADNGRETAPALVTDTAAVAGADTAAASGTRRTPGVR